ncbi:protein glass-like [Penaeus monodon]|uniref:protein glass-like n=1 Tax=Penaeus monodon TaxID=6687 RepID=UPI0018A6D62A|nr:protein glass-like [Penaeus monodon]
MKAYSTDGKELESHVMIAGGDILPRIRMKKMLYCGSLSVSSNCSSGCRLVPALIRLGRPNWKYQQTSNFDSVQLTYCSWGERPFSCPDCQHQFTQSSALKAHMRIVHKQDKLYFCEYCHVRFRQRTSLQEHVYKVHGR